MDVGKFDFDDPNLAAIQEEYLHEGGLKDVKYLSFNILRIEEPFLKKKIDNDDRILAMAPMIAYSSEEPFGKYDVVETEL